MEVSSNSPNQNPLDRISKVRVNTVKKLLFFSAGLLLLLIGLILMLFFSKRSKNNVELHQMLRKQNQSSEIINHRVSHLQKGIDISVWFRFPLDETDEYFNNYISDEDLNLIEKSGFTHVRLSLAPQYVFDIATPAKINTHMLPFIDKAISRILQHHLAVVVDIHDEKRTFENESNATNFISFWSNFAKHLTQFDANNVYLEMLNEPIFDRKAEKWLALQEKLLKVVREQAPSNTIIATGANWGGIEGLKEMIPYQDSNIIYSFHYYEPSAFTHQGADWAGNDYLTIANLDYPYNVSNCERVLSSVKTEGGKDLVNEYCDKKWNKDTIINLIQGAVDWSKSNKVPIWVGEFGVYCKQTPRQSKLQWIKDAKDIFEQNHIGWTLWAYDDCFGLGASKVDGKITYDKEVLHTLGVKNETKKSQHNQPVWTRQKEPRYNLNK